jgi:hypothetical protein
MGIDDGKYQNKLFEAIYNEIHKERLQESEDDFEVYEDE